MKKKVVLSLLLSVTLAAQTPILAYADQTETVVSNEGSEVKVDGEDIKVNEGPGAVASGEDSKLIINGSVSSTGEESGPGVVAEDKATVEVKGDVSSENEPGVVANNATVTVTGNVSSENAPGVVANNATVTVTGNVSSENTPGVVAEDEATVEVKGDVSSTSENAVTVRNNSSVTVDGNVNGGVVTNDDEKEFDRPGVYVDNTSTIIVENGTVSSGLGDIEYPEDPEDPEDPDAVWASAPGVIIGLEKSSGAGMVVIKEIVSSDYFPIWIEYVRNEDDSIKYDPDTDDEMLNALPTIIVGEMTSTGEFSGYIGSEYIAKGDSDAFNKNILQKINYLIGVQSVENGSIKVEGTKKLYNKYEVATAGEELKITVTPNDGYEITSVSGGKAAAVKNADGTYTITVVDGGGIDISAVIRAIVKAEAVKEEINEVVNVEPPKETFVSNSVPGIEINDWQDVSTVLETKQDKLQTAPASDVKMLQIVLPKNKVEIPKNVVASVNKAKSAWLHCFVGNGNAVTFYNNDTLANYVPTDFTLKETETKNIKTIEFAKTQAIGTTVLFSTRVKVKNQPVTVWEWQNGQFVVLGTYTTTENGNLAFPITSTGRYAITY